MKSFIKLLIETLEHFVLLFQILQGLVDVRIPHNDFYREGLYLDRS